MRVRDPLPPGAGVGMGAPLPFAGEGGGVSGAKNGYWYQPHVRTSGHGRAWNLKKLRSREDPLVFFTLATQLVVGAFLALFLGPLFGLDTLAGAQHPRVFSGLLFALVGVQTLALGWSTAHLGKPHRFYRAFNNLRYSPVSREVAGIAVFYNLLLGYALLTSFPEMFAWLPEGFATKLGAMIGWGAAVAGPVALYFMHAIYRIPARPFWNHWQVLTSFYGNMAALGALAVGLVYAGVLAAEGQSYVDLLQALSLPMAAGLLLEAFGLVFHARALRRAKDEGAASHYVQTTTFGYTYYARNAGLAFGVLLVIILGVVDVDGAAGLFVWGLATLVIVATAAISRALFYVLVIPTTMPGAFFWRNPGFQEHARATGLAQMPQVGVVPEGH